tara:strand:- start:183 stop:443 length:261 start_codon:yes stop_codon:yes gene_type:complete
MSYDEDIPSIGGKVNLDPHEVDKLEQLRAIHTGLNYAIGDYESIMFQEEMLFKGQRRYCEILLEYRKRVKNAIVELEILGFCMGVE